MFLWSYQNNNSSSNNNKTAEGRIHTAGFLCYSFGHAQLRIRVHVEVRGQRPYLPLLHSTLIFKTGPLTEPGSHWLGPGCLGNQLQGSVYLHTVPKLITLGLGLQILRCTLLSHGFWRPPNSGPPVCAESTLPTELPPNLGIFWDRASKSQAGLGFQTLGLQVWATRAPGSRSCVLVCGPLVYLCHKQASPAGFMVNSRFHEHFQSTQH